MQTVDLLQTEEIYTISRLNNEVRFLLEDTYASIWVEGEISNFAAPNSGHWYFSLKDSSAQVRCAMFKGHQRKLGFLPKDGMHVLIKARVSLYENRGEFQLIAEHMEERGEGKLRRAYEMLRKKLEAAGLFDPEHKKALPTFPKQIGIITSATGAAIRDILTVLKRRHASVPVIIYPTLVQGETAAGTIVEAIKTANRRNECDVLILARGGGSLEDLWSFNEEIVAHAIYQSQIPMISAIGHEVDFTIADFVADKRAPTPSAAAEIVTPDCTELLQNLLRNKQVLLQQMSRKLSAIKQQLSWMEKHLQQQHPKRRLAEKMQRIDFCELALVQLINRKIAKLQSQTKDYANELQQLTPSHQVRTALHQLHLQQQNLDTLMLMKVSKIKSNLANYAAKLDALSPLATMQRGYTITTDKENNLLRSIKNVQKGDEINLRLIDGTLDCVVKDICS